MNSDISFNTQIKNNAGNIYPVDPKAVRRLFKLLGHPSLRHNQPPSTPPKHPRLSPRAKAKLIRETYTNDLLTQLRDQFIAGATLKELAENEEIPITAITLKKLLIENGLWTHQAEQRLAEIKQNNARRAQKTRSNHEKRNKDTA